ncbi:MAG: chorismate mutase [Clostridium sp.]
MNNCKDLSEVRENIDRIDKQIIKFIAERSCYVKQAATFKKDSDDVKAPKRVEIVIEKVRKIAEENNVNPNIVEVVYRNMIEAFINIELEEHSQINKKAVK